MIRIHSVNSQSNLLSRPSILLALTLGTCAALAGLAMAADTAIDVPANDPGFYMHHFEYDPPAEGHSITGRKLHFP